MKSLIRWFAYNSVAANLLMIFIVLSGLYAVMKKIPLEVFPAFESDRVTISIPYRGATPSEVEEAIVIRTEASIHDLHGIKEITSSAREGMATITVQVEMGIDIRELLNDIKSRVDAIDSFPGNSDRPIYEIASGRHSREVISVVIAGNLSERELREIGEQTRDQLENIPGISSTELTEIRPYEISVEISEALQKQYNLSLATVANAIRQSSINVPAGSIDTEGGEILLRIKEQAYGKEDIQKIPLRTRLDGTRLLIGDIATVRDAFAEEPLFAWFNQKPCVVIDVYRSDAQNVIKLAEKIKNYVHNNQDQFPSGIDIYYWRDYSRILTSRLGILWKNALQGGILVFLLLALFLRFTIALWVCIGIPVSFMGALACMPMFGISINIGSLFAFILVLGIVVDDAIVTGENIFTRLKTMKNATDAAIIGTQEVSVPVTFGILTTIVAFSPLLFMEGPRSKIGSQIALVVMPVLIFSLIESKFILPSHLKSMSIKEDTSWGVLSRLQMLIADGYEKGILRFYRPLLSVALKNKYTTLSLFLGFLIFSMGFVFSGRVRFLPFPIVPSEVARANLTMPIGTPFEVTKKHIERITEAANKLKERYRDQDSNKSVIRDILSTPGSVGSTSGQSHIGRVMFEIIPPEERDLDISTYDLVQEWRQEIGTIIGAQKLSFRSEIIHTGAAIEIQFLGSDLQELEHITARVKEKLAEYDGVFDVADSLTNGKEEIHISLKPEGELLGITSEAIAQQVRGAFFGWEAQRIQRNRDDVRIMVRYPKSQRRSLTDLSSMYIRTASGSEIPFNSVAEISFTRGYEKINRINHQRTISVTADFDKKRTNTRVLYLDLREYLGKLLADYPGITFNIEGEEGEWRESMQTLIPGMILVLFSIYALLAIPFKSYVQPVIVMSVIPFGVLGSFLGHLIMGLPITLYSIFGILALIGVVVNDSLVLVDYINQQHFQGTPLFEAVRRGGVVRFRAISLTSITTFAGLMPLIFDKSTNAQFLIPMAVSLGFGILFATIVTLFMVPINYLILEDIRRIFNRKGE